MAGVTKGKKLKSKPKKLTMNNKHGAASKKATRTKIINQR